MNLSGQPITPAGPGGTMNHGRLRFFEMFLAAVCAPLLTIITPLLIFQLDELTSHRSQGHFQILELLMITGAVVLAAAIWLDLRAIERFPASTAADVRGILATSTLGSLAFLAVWVTDQAQRAESQYAGETILFLCLPTLFICAVLSWFTARAVKRAPFRAFLLTGLILATGWVEWQCQAGNRSHDEERMFMMNSLLVAFVVAVRLGVWGATEFSPSSKVPGS